MYVPFLGTYKRKQEATVPCQFSLLITFLVCYMRENKLQVQDYHRHGILQGLDFFLLKPDLTFIKYKYTGNSLFTTIITFS